MTKLLIAFLLASACLSAAPHAWDCFVVDSITTNPENGTFETRAHNKCDQAIPHVVLLVKYLDKDGNRIGVGAAFEANFVAPHEKFRRESPITNPRGIEEPYVRRNVRSVGVRAIREDPLDAWELGTVSVARSVQGLTAMRPARARRPVEDHRMLCAWTTSTLRHP